MPEGESGYFGPSYPALGAPARPFAMTGAGISARMPRLGARQVLVGAGATALTALVIGIPTDVVPNPWFTRMTPVRLEDQVFLIASSVLTGALAASYALSGERCPLRAPGAGGALALFAIACPVCNKLVVALLGAGGALSYYEPVQPLLGLLSLALIGSALAIRISQLRRVPAG